MAKLVTYEDGSQYWTSGTKVVCADGYTISIQAGNGCEDKRYPALSESVSYCTPRKVGEGPFSAVELGFPSEHDSLIEYYREGNGFNDDPQTGCVFPYVPAEVVVELLKKHGGLVSGEPPTLLREDRSIVLEDGSIVYRAKRGASRDSTPVL